MYISYQLEIDIYLYIKFADDKVSKGFETTKSIEINSSIDLNSTYAGPSDESNNALNSFDLDPTSDLLDEHETTLHENQEFSNDFLNNSAYTDDIQASL
ncbi:hypothetical protein F8M41_023528 [Gigaspora margarita]|uniref:Uncharacterized protein n=1 Tax=Gigaspora margarita TaxID=4874 RepID=A0A8H4EHB9_GIGMA|nr:hypothetical protein F8M41_023528 [Gigaspora margarita]